VALAQIVAESVSEYTLLDYSARSTAVVRARLRLAELPLFFARTIAHVLAAIEAQDATPGGEPFAYYRGVPNGTVDIEAGFPVSDGFAAFEDVVPAQLPGGRVVPGVHIGPYASVARTYEAMRQWAIAHGLEPDR
jgi:effector-binding domain-containing protein